MKKFNVSSAYNDYVFLTPLTSSALVFSVPFHTAL